MAVSPKLPKLAPEDMQWVRWVTKNIGEHDTSIGQLGTRVQAANIQRNTVSSNAAKTTESTNNSTTPTNQQAPVGDPQTPTQPQLSSDHATVTVYWDGNVTTNGVVSTPAQGFDYVTVQRSTDSGNYSTIGTHMGRAGTLVDADVVVGTRYWYRLVSTDTLQRNSTPSTPLSIIVKGVDTGSLDDDLKQTLNDIQHSQTTGGLVVYSDEAPTDPKYEDPSAIWFDTSNPNGAVAKRWDANSKTWVAVPFGEGALGPGSITASKILAGAIDTAALGAGVITAEKIEAGAITAEKLGADSVTANAIVAGSVDANKLAVGAVDAKAISLGAALPTANAVNRVPKPLTDTTYWSAVISGAIVLNASGPTRNASSTAGGIVLSPTSAQYAGLYVTAKLSVPQSRAIHISGNASSTNVKWVVRTYDTNGNFLRQFYQDDSVTYNFLATDGYYEVAIVAPETTPGSYTVSSVQVFEAIGGQVGSKQAAQLTPSGLRLFNDAGSLSVDLSTSTQNFLSIYNSGAALATIDENGDGTFNALTVNDDMYFNGDNLVGSFDSFTRADGPLSGPYLERMPRGVQYASTWSGMNGFTLNDQYQRLATGSFNLAPNRSFSFETNLSGLQTATAGSNLGFNCYVELQLSTTPLTSVTSGTVVARSVVFDGTAGYWNLEPAFFTTPFGAGFDTTKCTLPPSTDIYWQINTNLSGSPTGVTTLQQYAYNPVFRVVDQGPAISVYDGTDRTIAGGTATGTAGSGSGGNSTGSGSSTTKSTTKTWTASWSGSWNQGGSNKVTGSGTYTDGNMLYQGYGASNMGSKFGFPASVQTTLAGKTVTKVEIFLQNRWTYNSSGGTATFAGHGNSSAGATFGSTNTGTFTRTFDRGQSRWLTIGNTEVPFTQWASGAVRGLALVVQGTVGNYSYYDGVGKSKPPVLRVTYK